MHGFDTRHKSRYKRLAAFGSRCRFPAKRHRPHIVDGNALGVSLTEIGILSGIQRIDFARMNIVIEQLQDSSV
jgi:hypothetical protein